KECSNQAGLPCCTTPPHNRALHINPVMLRATLLDDYVDTADAISMVLGLSGFDAAAVYGGGAAIDATARWRPEIVLLDIWMPDMSGLDVAGRLRENRKTSDLVLIAHSAAAGERDLERANVVSPLRRAAASRS
ncbi:response regulator, partial [Caballeronia concitans]